ncbi:hypothetical protein [Phaeocystidibacter luteus]|uniref:Outer membrane beta-barrel protein n=1 Tax=Phaeocystidibacter luteus TaxID=911197 RepID=A0A6N6RLY3_9FLAO|nr:hypothetical protein [Phaeocystidibacter luteus]KAB2814591.1 hypothetical protein F8C67_02290 [Phaeocystidibacter luteus]
MKKRLFISLLLTSIISQAQLPDIWGDGDSESDTEREHYVYFSSVSSLDFGYGYTQSFRSFKKGVPSDYLAGFQAPYHTLHFNFEYGFKHGYNWFIWAGGSVYIQIADREEQLRDAIPDYYPNFVVKQMDQLSSEDSEGNEINADRSPVNWSFGAGYQINKRSFAINMKAGMSITAIPNLQTRATLKELNTNNYHELSYYVLDNPISNGLGINAALSIRYFFNDEFGVFIAADFNRNWYDWEYEEEFYNLFTGESSSTFYNYNGFLDFYQIRAGVSIYL